ncbi:hypothetical protein TIFTF001_013434 [Ficus carica]|uniref:Uncharacterized protein n=1 Tax=Ficus carica TaxID=3494 RepID=A0AA88D4L6_FICCA|nr:hypothetical protein TIFTF001_013434 [Ficus carica]
MSSPKMATSITKTRIFSSSFVQTPRAFCRFAVEESESDSNNTTVPFSVQNPTFLSCVPSRKELQQMNFPKTMDKTWSEKMSWKKVNSAEMRSKLAKLGLAAVLAYGLFDGVTYISFFVMAFLGYEKSTGKNPAANLQALLRIVILMWTGNNITRPFRVAGCSCIGTLD